MLEIWGRKNSLNVQKVLWCCEELGLAFHRIDAGGPFGRTDDAEYRALNPTGLVPTLVDDGFSLWESNAIVRYLCARYGDGLLQPSDPLERARADMWMDWQTTAVWARLRYAFLSLVRTPAAERDPDAIAAAIEGSGALWSILDAHLADNPYVLGADFTMADIPLGTTVNRWFALDIERPSLPYLHAWYERLLQRPAYQQVVASIPLT